MRILIIRLGAIGDIVHTLPALAALRRCQPTSHIAWAVESGPGSALLSGNPCLDEVIELDMRMWREALNNQIAGQAIRLTLRKLRSEPFDISLDFQGLLKSSAVSWFANSARKVGFDYLSLREPASGLLLTERVKVSDRDHVIKKNLDLVKHLGCAVDSPYHFPISCSIEDELYVESQLSDVNGSFAILNPGGGWTTKLWRPQHYARIIDLLWRYRGIRSLVTVGPGEEALADETVSRSLSGKALPIRTTLKQFFVLAKRASLFVGGDTGPMHLAAAAGTPIVALFGPTSPIRNGPFHRDDVVIARQDLECRVECYRRRCDHCSCMDLPTETVWQGVLTRLDRSQNGRDQLTANDSTFEGYRQINDVSKN